MKVTVTIKNATKNEVLEKCLMGYDYEQVGNDVTILYETKGIARADLKDWTGDYIMEDGWYFIDLITLKPKIEK